MKISDIKTADNISISEFSHNNSWWYLFDTGPVEVYLIQISAGIMGDGNGRISLRGYNHNFQNGFDMQNCYLYTSKKSCFEAFAKFLMEKSNKALKDGES